VVQAGIYRVYVDCNPERNSEDALMPGPAKKVTIHLNEDTSFRSNYLGGKVLSGGRMEARYTSVLKMAAGSAR
jgi:hypothetical protein